MTKDLELSKMYKELSASNKEFLMKKLFNPKMADSGSVARHLNKFNTLTSQLELVEIIFKDEIKMLVMLSNLPEAWDSLMNAMSNSCGTVWWVYFLAKRHTGSLRGRLRH